MTDRTGPRDRDPMRTCVGCRATDSWSALLRVVAATGEHDGDVALVPDPRHRLPGRGAWLHPDSACFEQAIRRKAFTRALRLQAGPDVSAVGAHLERVARDQEAQHDPQQGPHQGRAPHQHLTTVHDRPTEGGSDADEHPMSTQQ